MEEKQKYSHEEVHAYSSLINTMLLNEQGLEDYLPLDTESENLFERLEDGVLIARLIHKINPEIIDLRALNTKKPLNIFKKKENLNLIISASKSTGAVVVGMFPEVFLEQIKYMELGLIWQLLKIWILSQINLKDCPYLVRLLKEGEDLTDLLKLTPDELLIRWFNYHLEQAGSERRIKNLSEDVKDGECYAILLNQLSPHKCKLDDAMSKTGDDRAAVVIQQSHKVGAASFTQPHHITSGNPKINLLFTASIFNACPGLEATEQEKKDAAGLLDDDIEGSREERAFRMYINSLGIEGVYVNNIYEDIRDGIVLLKVMERVQPGCVDWKKAELNPNNKFKKLTNANLAVDIGKKFGFSLVGIGGVDLVDGNKKLSLALVWQLVRQHTLQILGGWTEEKLLEWANSRGNGLHINNFRDSSIKNCKFLFQVITSIDKDVVGWDIVIEGETPEAIENNAKYVISCARKLGATVFLLWDDIRDVKPKMIMAFIAALAQVAHGVRPEAMPDIYAKTTTTN